MRLDGVEVTCHMQSSFQVAACGGMVEAEGVEPSRRVSLQNPAPADLGRPPNDENPRPAKVVGFVLGGGNFSHAGAQHLGQSVEINATNVR